MDNFSFAYYTSPDAANGAMFSGNPRDTGSQAGAAPSENSTTAGTERKESRYSGRQRDEEAKARRDEAPTTLSAERDEMQAKSGISASRFTSRTGTEQSSHAHASLKQQSHTQDGHAQDGHAQADAGQPNTPKMPADIPAASASGETDAAPKPTRYTNRPHEEGRPNQSGQTMPVGQTPPASASATGEKRTENGTASSRFTGRTDAAHDSRTQNRQTQNTSGQTSHTQDHQAQGSHTQNNLEQSGHTRDSLAKAETGTAGQTRLPSGTPAVLPKPAESSNSHTSGKGGTSADTIGNTRFTHTDGNAPNTRKEKPGASPSGATAPVDSATRPDRTAAGLAAVLSGQEKAEQHTETRFTTRPAQTDDKQSPQESLKAAANSVMGPAKAGVPAGNAAETKTRTTAQVTDKTATTATEKTTSETSMRATTRPAGNVPGASPVTGRSGTERTAPHQTSDSGEKSSAAKPGAIPRQTIPAAGPEVRSGSPTGTAGTSSPSEAGRQGETRFTSVHRDAAPQGTAAGSTVSGSVVPGSTIPGSMAVGGTVSRNDAHSGTPAAHAPIIAPSNAASTSADRKEMDSSVKETDSSGTAAANTRFTNLPGSAPRPSPEGTKSGAGAVRFPEPHAGGVNIGAQTVPSGKAGETNQNNTRMTQRDTRTGSQSAHMDHRMSERDTQTAQQDTLSTQRDSRTSLRTEADTSRNNAAPSIKTAPQNMADAPRPGTAGTGTAGTKTGLDTRQTARPSGSEVNRETRQDMGRVPASSPIPASTGNSTVMRSDAATLRTDSSTSRFTSVPGARTADSVNAARGGTVSMSHSAESPHPANAVPGSIAGTAGALRPSLSSGTEQGSPGRGAVSKPGIPGIPGIPGSQGQGSPGQGSPGKDAAAGSVGNSLGTLPTPRSGMTGGRSFSDYRQTAREQSQATKTESETSGAGAMQPPVRVTSSPLSGGADTPSRPARPGAAVPVSGTVTRQTAQQTAERRDSVPMLTHEHSSTVDPQSTRIPRPDQVRQESVKVPGGDGREAHDTQAGSAVVNFHIPIPNVTGGGAAAFRPGADHPARGEHPANQGTASARPGSPIVAGQRPIPAQQERPQEHPARREHPNADHPAKQEIAAASIKTENSPNPVRQESTTIVSTQTHSPGKGGHATVPAVTRTTAAGRQETPTSNSSPLSPHQVEARQRGQSRTSGPAVKPDAGQNAAGPVPIQQAKGSIAPLVRGTAAAPVSRQTMRGQNGTMNAPGSVIQQHTAARNAAQRPAPAQTGRNATPQGRTAFTRTPQYSGQGVHSGTAGTAPNPTERTPRGINGSPAARNIGAQQNQDQRGPNPAQRNYRSAETAGAAGKPAGAGIDSLQERSPLSGQNPQSKQKHRQQSGGDERKPLFGLFDFGKNQTTRQSGRNQNGGSNPNRNVRG